LYGSRRPSEAYGTNSAPDNFQCSCGLAQVSAPIQENGVVHSFCIILMILWIVCASEIENTRVNRKLLTSLCGIFRLIHIFISTVRKLKTKKTDWSPSIKQLQQGMSICSAMSILHICWGTCHTSTSVADHPRYHTDLASWQYYTQHLHFFVCTSEYTDKSYFTHTYCTVYKLHILSETCWCNLCMV
jgi:hypothetical protein